MIPTLVADGQVLASVNGRLGVLTLNRPAALNALSLAMIRDLTAVLRAWATDASVDAVFLQGAGREGKPAAFCAGGDIRFFHQAALAGDPRLEDFFSEEYALNHLIHRYRKPIVAWMDGVVMGGGMGIVQGASHRVVTESAKLAMPETNIGLFPDVGGGWFLARCPGHLGEYLALTGHVLGAADAIACGLADQSLPAESRQTLIERLQGEARLDEAAIGRHLSALARPAGAPALAAHREAIDRHFSAPTVGSLVDSLKTAGDDPFARDTLALLRKRSPLMVSVTLEQVRRARTMSLADELRMERDLVRHCFHLRPGPASETVEGIRALAVDKDHAPRWNPSNLEDVTTEQVAAFFDSPWPAHAHPLRDLVD